MFTITLTADQVSHLLDVLEEEKTRQAATAERAKVQRTRRAALYAIEMAEGISEVLIAVRASAPLQEAPDLVPSGDGR